MGGGGFLGMGGSPSKPDTSAYERQLAEQREATRVAEEKAARVKSEADDAARRQSAGRLNTLLTGAGDEDTSMVKRKSLLGTGA